MSEAWNVLIRLQTCFFCSSHSKVMQFLFCPLGGTAVLNKQGVRVLHETELRERKYIF